MYQPSKKILERYASVVVHFALGKGKGVQKGEVVYLKAYENAKPFFIEIAKAITKTGGHVIAEYLPSDEPGVSFEKEFYLHAKDHQLSFFPSRYYRGLVDEMDHQVFVLGETDNEALSGIDPKKIMLHSKSLNQYREWRHDKEYAGKFSWTLVLYGTPAMAKEAGLSEKEYWDQIIKACFLNTSNPVEKWRSVERGLGVLVKKINRLPIDRLHMTGPDCDLWIKLGEKRIWESGGGANIPSFEIFTSPDAHGTEGWIRFNQPFYTDGNVVKGVELTFSKGRVVKARASMNEKFLKSMIRVPSADRIGEFSLTDKRFSNISKFMATTLYDENMGKPNGNTHLALGNSFHDCYAGDPTKVSKKEWARLGFNDSAIHQDIISTAPRTVRAYLRDGKEKIIYKNGMFSL